MTTKNDGGPAFPVPHAMEGYQGMTLRDWFAGQALAGFRADPEFSFGHLWRNDKGEVRILQGANHPVEDGTNWRHIASPMERLAAQCYADADAMLAAREAK